MMRIAKVLPALAALILAPPGRAAGPEPRSWVPEYFEMLGSILTKGADMGPGQGWFHPAQSRYGWPWLVARFDADKDGAISPGELKGNARLFRRLDRDGDDLVTAEDFDWSMNSAYLRARAMARPRFGMADANSNGKVSLAEWDALFARAARGKKFLTMDDLADLFYSAPPRRRPAPGASPPGSEGPSKWTLVKGLVQGEIGSPFEGPRVGARAPEFTLRTPDRKEAISLAEFRGKKPVVLIFGSFT